MLLLKFCCPFGGRHYPYIVTAAVAVIALLAASQADFSPQTATAAMLFAAAVSLLICWLIENIPSDEERAIIADTAPPLWQPAPEKLRKKAAERAKLPSKSIVILTVGCSFAAIVFLCTFAKNAGYTLPVCAFLAGVFVLLIDFLCRMYFRSSLDDSAMCVIIPVDRVYDVETTARHSFRITGHHNLSILYSSYLIFYLPDGRYTLPVPDTDGRFNAVALVKCRGILRWTPVYQEGNNITPV